MARVPGKKTDGRRDWAAFRKEEELVDIYWLGQNLRLNIKAGTAEAKSCIICKAVETHLTDL